MIKFVGGSGSMGAARSVGGRVRIRAVRSVVEDLKGVEVRAGEAAHAASCVGGNSGMLRRSK